MHDAKFFEKFHTDIKPYAERPVWPWHSSSPLAGWVAFLVADPTGEIHQEWTNDPESWLVNYIGAPDVRMSWNTFYSTSSKATNILHYHCCFADLDYRKIVKYKDTHPNDMSLIVQKFCAENDLPDPSLIISTGNGLHVAWRFAIPSTARWATPRYVQKKENTAIENTYGWMYWEKFNEYNKMQKKLAQVLAPLGADPVAIDAGKYMRLPGTINAKAEAAGRDGLVRIVHEGPRLYWPDLRDALGVPCMSGPCAGQAPAAAARPKTTRKTATTKAQEKQEKKPAPFQVVRGGAERPDQADTKEQTWGTWVNVDGERRWVVWKNYNALRYWDLYTLMELRREKNGGTIPEGERSNFLTWLLNFWALWNLEELDEQEFNRAFPYVFRLLADQIDPRYRKGDKYAAMRVRTIQKKWGQGWVSCQGTATKALYTPQTLTLIAKFGVTTEELPYLITFQPTDTKERARERKKAQRRREGVRPREEYLKNTVTAMAAAEGISPKTWRRRHPEYIGEKTLKKHPELGAKAE